MNNVNKDITHYVHRHTFLVSAFILAVFILLASGEYYLFRKVNYVSKMVSEGMMQIKEANRVRGQVTMKNGKMMMRRSGEFAPMEMSLLMPSGMRVMMDGTVVKPDGIRLRLQDGQMMELE